MRRSLRRRRFLRMGAAMMLTQACRTSPEPDGVWKWRCLPDLPLGLGGQFAGIHNGALIAAGGSRFPVPKWEGGAKEWASYGFVPDDAHAEWKRFSIPYPLGYGGLISHARALLLGGGDAERN